MDLNALRSYFEATQNNDEEGGGRNSQFVRFPKGEGVTTVRFLPGAPAGMFGPEESPFFVEYGVFNINGKWLQDNRTPDPENPKYLVGHNPLADFLRWLWKEGESRGGAEKNRIQARYRQIKRKPQFLFNVIVREERGPNNTVLKDVGPKVLRVGPQIKDRIFLGILGDQKMKKKGKGLVADPAKGYDFNVTQEITKNEKGDDVPTYVNSFFEDEPSPAGTPEQWKAWIAGLHDLRSFVTPASADDFQNELDIYLGKKAAEKKGFDPNAYGISADFAAGLGGTPPAQKTAVSVPAELTYEPAAPAPGITMPTAAPAPAPAPVEPPKSEYDFGATMDADDFMAKLKATPTNAF